MGEVAEMMLDGTLCQCCGDDLGEPDDDDFEPAGYPITCSDCIEHNQDKTNHGADHA